MNYINTMNDDYRKESGKKSELAPSATNERTAWTRFSLSPDAGFKYAD